ncbi:MAG TPA: BACON domain-containing protein [Candidatus Tidjanibacter gallistercoris]|nr:BACON domain-containing protein [Candidatus Tidjanibacter gallistercoris]
MKKNLFLPTLLLAAVVMEGCRKEEQAPPTLSVTPSEAVVFEASGGVVVIAVETNQESWKAVSDQAWCRIDVVDGTSFSVTADANESTEARPSAKVTVTAGHGANAPTAVLEVSQKGAAEEKPEPEGKPFGITLSDITSSAVVMKVVPRDAEGMYYFDVISKATLDEHHGGDIGRMMAGMMQEAEKMYGSIGEALANLASTGEQEHTFTRLVSDTEYVAFAAGLGADGAVNTEIASEPFRTAALSDAVTFDVEFTNLYFDGADFTVTPSDDDFTYYCAIRPAFQYGDLSDEELLEQLVAEDGFMIDFYATAGVYEYTNEHVWLTDTGYLVLVFGWADGAPSSGIYRFPFRTLEPDSPPAACTFTVNVTDVTSRSATVGILPSDPTAVYMWDLIAEADYRQYEEDMTRYVTEYVAHYTADIGQLDYNRERGESGNIYSKQLEPGTTYYVWAACIDEYGKPAADVLVSEPFATLPNTESAARVDAVIGKYFDGDDLYGLDPEKYADGRGMAYVQVTFSANEEAAVWYGTLVKEDPSDPTDAISDAEIAETLVAAGTWCPTGKLYWCAWDSEYTVLGVAVGRDDNNGPVLRLRTVFTKEGASPVSEFTEPAVATAQYVYRVPFVRYDASVKAYRAPRTKK